MKHLRPTAVLANRVCTGSGNGLAKTTNRNATIILTMLYLIMPCFVQAQHSYSTAPHEEWMKTFNFKVGQTTHNEDAEDWAEEVIQTRDGYYIGAGFTQTQYSTGGNYPRGSVMKLDANGNMIWHIVKDLPTLPYEHYYGSVFENYLGELIVSGYVNKTPDDVILAKYDKNGNELIYKIMNDGIQNSNNITIPTSFGMNSIIETPDHRYLISGGETVTCAVGSRNVAVLYYLNQNLEATERIEVSDCNNMSNTTSESGGKVTLWLDNTGIWKGYYLTTKLTDLAVGNNNADIRLYKLDKNFTATPFKIWTNPVTLDCKVDYYDPKNINIRTSSNIVEDVIISNSSTRGILPSDLYGDNPFEIHQRKDGKISVNFQSSFIFREPDDPKTYFVHNKSLGGFQEYGEYQEALIFSAIITDNGNTGTKNTIEFLGTAAGDDFHLTAFEDADDGLVIGYSAAAGTPTITVEEALFMAKFDKDLTSTTPLWRIYQNGSNNTEREGCLFGAFPTQDGGYIVAGNNEDDNDNYIFIKYQTDCHLAQGGLSGEVEMPGGTLVVGTTTPNSGSTYYLESPLIVPNGGTLNLNNNVVKVQVDNAVGITVKSGAVLNLNDAILKFESVSFPGILVEAGGTLNISNGSVLTNLCPGNMWKGVEVQGTGPSTTIGLPLQGVVNLYYTGAANKINTVENATVGINSSDLNFNHGGQIFADNAIFRNNKVAIKIEQLSGPESGTGYYNNSIIINSKFLQTIPLNGTANQGIESFISLHNVMGIHINGNEFDNQVADNRLYLGKRGTGIVALDATFIARAIDDVADIAGVNAPSGPYN